MTTEQYEQLMRILSGETGAIARELNRQPQPRAKAGALSSYARYISTTAIECLMVGLEQEALQLLTKSDEWMTAALERTAAGEVIELEEKRHFKLSVCRWLLGPPATPFDLTRGCQLLHESEMMSLANCGEYADLLDSTLAALVYAGRYEECIAKFEQEKAKVPRSKRQRRTNAMRDFYAGNISADEAAALQEEHVEAPMAYLIARERLKPTLSEAKINQRFAAFLQSQVPHWANRACYDLLTMWIRIATQAEAGAPARKAVRDIADRYA